MHTFRHFLSYLVKNFVEIPFLSPEFSELCKQEAARSFVNCVVYCKKSRLTSIILSFQQTEQNHHPQQEFHLMKEKCVSWRGSSFHHSPGMRPHNVGIIQQKFTQKVKVDSENPSWMSFVAWQSKNCSSPDQVSTHRPVSSHHHGPILDSIHQFNKSVI